jgi:predicted secreted Zn-dependent protease
VLDPLWRKGNSWPCQPRAAERERSSVVGASTGPRGWHPFDYPTGAERLEGRRVNSRSAFASRSVRRVILGACLAPPVLSCASATTAASSLAAQTRARIDTVFYAVPGTTPLEWRSFMNEHGPGLPTSRSAAIARWHVVPHYRLAQSGHVCRPTTGYVELTVTFVFPSLADTTDVSVDHLAEWRRFTRHLWRHEDGHVVRAYRAASELAHTIGELATPTCSDAARTIAASVRSVVAAYSERQREYDRRTRSGARQGANLPSADGLRFDEDTSFVDTLPRAL